MITIDDITQLQVNDWTDQDRPDDAAEITLLSGRLNAMQSVRDEYSYPPDGT